MVSRMIRVQSECFDIAAELKAFEGVADGTGAMASFTGYVRNEAGKVSALTLQHYPGFTESEIARIDTLAREKFDISDTLIIHRYGRMLPGEPIVLVAALAAHRKPAFHAVDFLMDYLKTNAPFWKKQEGKLGDTWIEPKEEDYSSRESW